jgi:hypothetical protein
MLGQVVYTIQTNKPINSINTSNLTTGVYFVKGEYWKRCCCREDNNRVRYKKAQVNINYEFNRTNKTSANFSVSLN